MLQLEHISKAYVSNSFTQVALDDVSLAFRDNEFVSILGPSGSGKTTMLNVIGGLDHFDSGDLIIDGISTREYKDRDWDAYRNNRIGFVFQSYNLIPHQTILANVELALTLSGVSAAERRERARKALEDVGLGDHVDKRPSQLSGGQMQRVAIARALINDPEILLADEPTGALDSKTSVQVMDLLRGVADDRLVIMVTHNPDLARQYSTRIVELADGRIQTDSNPFVPTPNDLRDAKPPRRTSMSFLTALALSFNNLMTKKGRTLMTAFAGSIGIIGIAAILALANGVNAYIKEVEEETLSVYPLQIMSSGFDMTSLLVDMQGDQAKQEDESADQASEENDKGKPPVREQRMVTSMFGSVGKNDLASLKKYLDDNGGGIDAYVQDIEYLYGVVPQIFDDDTAKEVRQINPDSTFAAFGMGTSSTSLMTSSAFSTNVFSQMPKDLGLIENQFDVKAGRWPKNHDELVLVLSRSGRLADVMSYAMGLRDHDELEDMVQKLANEEEFEAPTDERSFTYEELMKPRFKVVPASSFYEYEEDYKVWTDKSKDDKFMRKLVDGGLELRIVGIVQPKEDVDATTINQGIYYTPELTSWLMKQAAESRIVKQQLADSKTNVITGKSFDKEAKERDDSLDMSKLFSFDESKLADAFSIDASALDFSDMDMSKLGEAMDFSNMEMPNIDMSELPAMDIDWQDLIDLSTIDLSAVDANAFDLPSLLTPEVIARLSPNLSNLDYAALLDGVTPTIDQSALSTTVGALQAGLVRYLAANPVNPSDSAAMTQAVTDYLATDEARDILAGVGNAVSFSDADRARIAKNLASQLSSDTGEQPSQDSLDSDTQEVVDQLREQISEQMGTEVADALATQIEETLSSAVVTAIGSYFEQAMSTYFEALGSTLSESLASSLGSALQEGLAGSMEGLASSMAEAFRIDQDAFAQAFSLNMDERELSELMLSLMSTERTSYDNNLVKLGYASESKPSEIDLYPLDFEAKAKVIEILDAYNDAATAAGDDDKTITYTDLVGALMTSVTDIVNMISYVLIAFVAISLVVSSIMIGVITYISVLERRKEIGILRSIGASKGDVSRVFNAETVIEGLVSGIMGVGITALACIPANIIVEANFGVDRVARLPLGAAIILVGVSVFLSFVAGLLPARKASKADPVEALRSE